MCKVKPCYVLADGLRLFCHEASLPFPGKSVGDCGITFDIFTHVSTGLFFVILFNFYNTSKWYKMVLLSLDIKSHIYKENNDTIIQHNNFVVQSQHIK